MTDTYRSVTVLYVDGEMDQGESDLFILSHEEFFAGKEKDTLSGMG